MTNIEKTVSFRLKAIDNESQSVIHVLYILYVYFSSWYILDTLESLQPNLFAT